MNPKIEKNYKFKELGTKNSMKLDKYDRQNINWDQKNGSILRLNEWIYLRGFKFRGVLKNEVTLSNRALYKNPRKI